MTKHIVSFVQQRFARLAVCALAAVILQPRQASAVPTIANGSFEEPAYSDPGIYSGGGADWTKTFMGPVAIVNGNVPDNFGNNRGATPFGVQYLGLDARHNGFLAGDSQTAHDFVAGQTYVLDLYVADSDGGPNPVLEILFSDNAGTNYLDTFYDVPFGGPYGDTIEFHEVTTLFTSPVDGDVTLSLYNSSTYPGPANSLSIDNVSITAVPEPSTWALLSLGAVGAGAVVLRRRWVA